MSISREARVSLMKARWSGWASVLGCVATLGCGEVGRRGGAPAASPAAQTGAQGVRKERGNLQDVLGGLAPAAAPAAAHEEDKRGRRRAKAGEAVRSVALMKLLGRDSAVAASAKASPALAAPKAEATIGLGYFGAGAGGLGLMGTGGGASGRYLAGAPAPRPTPRLDPNARYATTYRPGAAALAAFDAALARGTIPPVYRDLVGAFGDRYAPELAAPAASAGALAVAVDLERAALPPAGGPLHLRVALRSAAAPQLPRARLAVSLVIDTSGSMQGRAIDNARRAAIALLDRLDAADSFSLVTFSNEARVLIPAGTIGPRRADARRRILAGVEANGGTNLAAGLDAGYALATRGDAPADAVRILMLLSDGQANAGDTDPASLAARAARAFQVGVQTSTFGLGDSFDGPLLAALADRGAGGNYYLADPDEIAPAFRRELDARLVPAALALEVRVRLRPDIAPTKIYGSRQLDTVDAAAVRAQEVSADAQAESRHHIARDRQHDAPGGMRFFIPAFARDDRHALLLALEVPPGVGERALGSVEIRYKDRLLGRNVTREIPIRARYAGGDAASAATVDRGVLRTIQAFAAGDSILSAAALVDAGDRRSAALLLNERATLLAAAARSLAEPRLADDGKRLARLAGAVGGVPDLLALSVLLRGSGARYLQ